MNKQEAIKLAPSYKELVLWNMRQEEEDGPWKKESLKIQLDNLANYAKGDPERYGVWSRDEATGLIYKDDIVVAGDIDMQIAHRELIDDITRDAKLDRTLPDAEIMRLIQRLAGDNSFNSHQDRLNKAYEWYKKHEGKKTGRHALVVGDINQYLLDYQFNSKSEIYGNQLRYWLAAVARHIFADFDGQYPIDFTLPIVSTTANGTQAQGVGKTWFFQWLTFNDFAEIDNWGTESMRQLSQHMFLFDEEAKLFNGRSIEKAKSSVTRSSFEVRMSYARSTDRRRNRYTIIAANHSRFLDDPSGARRFPVIELGNVDGRLFDSRNDLNEDLLNAVWGQAVNDWKSGWIDANEEEITDEMRTRGSLRRNVSLVEEVVKLYTHYTTDPYELQKAKESDLINYIEDGVPNIDLDEPGVAYVSAKKAKFVIGQVLPELRQKDIADAFTDSSEHYLTTKPYSNTRYSSRYGKGRTGSNTSIWVNPAFIKGPEDGYALKDDVEK